MRRRPASCCTFITMASGSAGSIPTKLRKRRSPRLWTLPANTSILCNASWKRSNGSGNDRMSGPYRDRQGEVNMPTFSRSLEASLHRALALANERHHEYATLEHLLLALIDDQDAAAVMRACNVDLEKLKRSLVAYIESELDTLVTEGGEDSKPTA